MLFANLFNNFVNRRSDNLLKRAAKPALEENYKYAWRWISYDSRSFAE